jgi:hypothetical protein
MKKYKIGRRKKIRETLAWKWDEGPEEVKENEKN